MGNTQSVIQEDPFNLHEINKSLDFYGTVCHDPAILIELVRTIIKHQQYDVAINVGSRIHSKIQQYEIARPQRLLRLTQLKEAIEEIDKLERNQKLSDLKTREQKFSERRRLQTEQSVFGSLPSYATSNEETHAQLHTDVATLMLNAVLEGTKADHQKTLEVIDYSLQYVKQPQNILKLGDILTSKHLFDLTIEISKRCHTILQTMQNDFLDRQNKLIQLQLLQEEADRLKTIKKYLTDARVAQFEKLQQFKDTMVVSVFEPKTIDEFEQVTLNIAKLMFGTLLDARDKLRANETITPQQETRFASLLEVALNWAIHADHIKNPGHLLNIAEFLHQRKEYNTSFQIGEVICGRINSLLTIRQQRQTTEQAHELLKQERDALMTQWKVLPEDKVGQLLDLQLQLKVDDLFPAYTKPSFDYSNLILNNAKNMLSCIVDRKHHIEHVEKRAITPQDEWYAKSQLELVLKNIEDPIHLCELARHIEKRFESDLVLLLGEQCQNRIKHIDILRATRRPIQVEIDQLEQEERNLAALKKPQKLPDQKVARLETLRKQIQELPPFPAYSRIYDVNQYDNLNLSVVQVMTNAILDNKVALENRIKDLYEKNDPSTIDEKKIASDRQAIQQKINEMVQLCLEKFSNPTHLMRFAQDMHSRNEHTVVQEVCNKAFSIIKKLEEQLQAAHPLNVQYQALKNEQQALQATKRDLEKTKQDKLEQLQAQLAKFTFPHFVKFCDVHQYDETKMELSRTSVLNGLDHLDLIEQKYAKDKFELDKPVGFLAAFGKKKDRNTIEKQHQQDKAKAQKATETSLNQVEEYNKDPNHVIRVLKNIIKRKVPEMVLRIAKHAFIRVKEVETLRQARDKASQHLILIQTEKTELQWKKRELDHEAAQKLVDLEAELANINRTVPDYLSTSDEHNEMLNDISRQIISALFDEGNKDPELDEESVEDFRTKGINLITNFASDPEHVMKLVKELKDKKMFSHAMKLGQHCLSLLVILKKDLQSRDLPTKERETLKKEKEFLDKNKKSLPADQLARLRELELHAKLVELMPAYYHLKIEYDDINLNLAKVLSEVSKERLQEWETNAKQDGVLSHDQVQEEKSKMIEESNTILRSTIANITEVEKLIQLAQEFQNKKEYYSVIIVGKYAEELIEKQAVLLAEKADLEAQYKETEQQILILTLKMAETKKKTKSEQRETREELEQKLYTLKLSLDKISVSSDEDELNEWTLKITEMMIEAAKIEDLNDELRDQTILAFKSDPANLNKRWDEVRNVCNAGEWDDVKKTLVQYVMKQKNADPKEQISLLMKDGLWQQCIEIFPSPSGSPDNLELLQNLWLEIEKTEPTVLEQLLGTVSKYMKRYFQEYKFDAIDPLIDQVQRRYPALIQPFLTTACDMVLLNILPSQYAAFVKMIKKFKRRLLFQLNRPKDWNTFFEYFKEQHKGKKRLLQMISLVGDSGWDLQVMMKHEPKKEGKVKRERNNNNNDDDDDNGGPKKKKRPTKKTAASPAAVDFNALQSLMPALTPMHMDSAFGMQANNPFGAMPFGIPSTPPLKLDDDNEEAEQEEEEEEEEEKNE